MTVGRDFRMTGRSVTLGFSIGDEEACAGNGSPPITVGHDLVVTGNCPKSAPLRGHDDFGRFLSGSATWRRRT
jgi:hypothetical protein